MWNKTPKRARRELFYMTGFLAVIILFITAGATLFYARQSRALAEEQKENLSAIADLKSSLIESWYQERINNAWGIADSRSLAEETDRWFKHPGDGHLKEALSVRFGSLLRYNQYESIILLKPDGTVMMAINDTSKHVGPRVTDFITQALGSGRVLTSDLYYCPEAKRPHMDFVAPIAYQGRRTGALILRVDPSRFFYPLIRSWPAPSRTSETLLVRQEGDSVLFLNDVRHRENTALKMKEPLTDTKLPAVMAVTGRTGTVEGYDYRGQPVLAALRKISGTSWVMVSKVDAEEVYAPVKRLFIAVALLAFLLAGVAAGAVGIVWYQRRNQYLESLMSAESQLKEANTKLLDSNQELAATVEELTASEQQLKAAEEELHQQLDDLTRNQVELLQSKQQFQLLADSAPDAIFIQIDGKYAYVNKACLSLYGAKRPEQLIDSPIIERIHPDFQEMVTERIRTINREKSDLPAVEYKHLKLDGTPVDVEVSVVPFEYKGDNGALVFMRDVTERRKIEQELRHSQKIEAIGLLAGGIAHDFNNMLAGIIGNVELLAMKLLGNRELSAYVNNIANAADHAATLTRQLLTFARKGRVIWQPTDIHNLINDTCGILEKTIDRRIMVNRQLDAVLPVVNGDPSQLENMLLNLGVNARDAMPEGGLLTFSTRDEVLNSDFIKNHGYQIEPGKYLLISISDTGDGMDNNTLKHIFEPFFTTKDPGKGTGLGLASVYGTIMNHKGAIEVKSEPGKGALFNIWLPSVMSVAPEKKAAGPLTDDLTGQGRILLVDDEEMVREAAQNLLKHLGYDVYTCSDGAEAVGFYSEHQNEIDLVIMDMIMPVMNGMDAFIKLKKINPKVKVLISSGFSAGRESNELFKLGLKGYLGKPYHLADLAAKIKKVIKES
jgi:PAS domain S-box-containing protein